MQKGIDDEGSPQQWSYLMLWPRHPHLITCLTDRNYSELLVSEEQDRLIQIQVTQHKTKDRGRSTMQRATINYDHPHHSILALALILKDFHFLLIFSFGFAKITTWDCQATCYILSINFLKGQI